MQPRIAACKSMIVRKRLVSTAMLTHPRFCGQDEEHDPGEDFEEYLACAVCGDNGEFSRLVLSFLLFCVHRCYRIRPLIFCSNLKCMSMILPHISELGKLERRTRNRSKKDKVICFKFKGPAADFRSCMCSTQTMRQRCRLASCR